MPSRTRRPARRKPDWTELSDEELLDVRLCDLHLKIKDSWLEPRIDQLKAELGKRNLRFAPHFWVSTEWFSPDGIPGIAVPFYLVHPRLRKLEKRQMLEVEGGSHEDCMRILRHETGHAIDTAFRLRRRRRYQEVFGKSSAPYPAVYTPRPLSRKFVLHLDWWYAQSHPLEDFAETFAVWLRPTSRWKRDYKGWPALEKLGYVDELMREVAGKRAPVKRRETLEPVSRLRQTLRTVYRKKHARYGRDYPDVYDRDLRRLFSDEPRYASREPAARFLRRERADLREMVSEWSGQYSYTIDLVLREMVERSRDLKLRMCRPEKETRIAAAVLLTVQVMGFVYSGRRGLVL